MPPLASIICIVGLLVYVLYIPRPEDLRGARVVDVTRIMFIVGLIVYLFCTCGGARTLLKQ